MSIMQGREHPTMLTNRTLHLFSGRAESFWFFGRSLGIILAALVVLDPTIGGDLKKPKAVLTWGTKGDGPGEFYSPIGIAINAKDEVFVTDLNNCRLQRF